MAPSAPQVAAFAGSVLIWRRCQIVLQFFLIGIFAFVGLLACGQFRCSRGQAIDPDIWELNILRFQFLDKAIVTDGLDKIINRRRNVFKNESLTMKLSKNVAVFKIADYREVGRRIIEETAANSGPRIGDDFIFRCLGADVPQAPSNSIGLITQTTFDSEDGIADDYIRRMQHGASWNSVAMAMHGIHWQSGAWEKAIRVNGEVSGNAGPGIEKMKYNQRDIAIWHIPKFNGFAIFGTQENIRSLPCLKDLLRQYIALLRGIHTSTQVSQGTDSDRYATDSNAYQCPLTPQVPPMETPLLGIPIIGFGGWVCWRSVLLLDDGRHGVVGWILFCVSCSAMLYGWCIFLPLVSS
jgi:hypothetical protein